MTQTRPWIIAVILIAIAFFMFNGFLFSIFNVGIPLTVTSNICTGTIKGQPISQEDCNIYGPNAYGSSSGGWSFSTAGEGTITLPESSKSARISATFRKLGGNANLQIFDYIAGSYVDPGFVFRLPSDFQYNNEESYNLSNQFLDQATHTIIKFKWNMQCDTNTQCSIGTERLRVTSFDSIVDTTSTVSTTTATTTILVGSQSTTTTATTVISGTAATSTIISAGQQATIGGGINTTTIIIFVAIAGAVLYYIYKKNKEG